MVSESVSRRFEALLAEHGRIVLKIAASYARGQADREDLAQEIAVQLWRAFPSYDESRPFTTWMYRIALNVAISRARRAGARPELALAAELEPADPRAPTRAAAPTDPFAPLPPWVVWNLVLCSLGLLATLLFIAWSRRRPELQRKLDENAAGFFLGRARRYVAELERFEREG